MVAVDGQAIGGNHRALEHGIADDRVAGRHDHPFDASLLGRLQHVPGAGHIGVDDLAAGAAPYVRPRRNMDDGVLPFRRTPHGGDVLDPGDREQRELRLVARRCEVEAGKLRLVSELTSDVAPEQAGRAGDETVGKPHGWISYGRCASR